jgi:ribosome-associated toxin RatA of RatAB toxin-antitoxin module
MKRFLFLLVIVLLSAGSAAASDVPSIRDLGIDPAAVAPIMGESQLILLHKEREHTWQLDGKEHKKSVAFISSMQVIDAPVSTVRGVVSGVEKYPEFVAEIKKVKVKTKDGQRLAAIKSENNAIIMSIGVDYTLAIGDTPEGDITWNLVEGDLDEFAARWEFFSLPGNKTLLAFTSWQDFASISFTVRTIIRAQPDFNTIIPVSSAAVLMNSIAKRASGLPAGAIKAAVDVPQIPMLSTGSAPMPLASMRKLAESGTFMLIHPVQWLKAKKGKPEEFLFMSAGAITQMPVDKLQGIVTHFDRIPEYLPKQVDTVQKVKTTDGTTAYDYKLKVGISILTVSVKYRLGYTDVTPHAVSFRNLSGDLEHVYGAWEFFDLGDGKSLVYYTTGSIVGEDAPAILKVGENMPNRDLIIGISSTALTINKLLPWLAKQP